MIFTIVKVCSLRSVKRTWYMYMYVHACTLMYMYYPRPQCSPRFSVFNVTGFMHVPLKRWEWAY